MEKELLKCCQNNFTIALLSPLGEQLNKFEFPSTKDEKLNMWRVQIDGRQQVISEANINFMIKWAKKFDFTTHLSKMDAESLSKL